MGNVRNQHFPKMFVTSIFLKCYLSYQKSSVYLFFSVVGSLCYFHMLSTLKSLKFFILEKINQHYFKNRLCSLQGFDELYQFYQLLTLYQTTNFWTGPNSKHLQTTFNPFPNKPWFLRDCSASLLKTLWEKEKLFGDFLPFPLNLKLSSANSFSLEDSKIIVWEKVKCCQNDNFCHRRGRKHC